MDDQIIFNGKVYQNVEEMPPQVRQAYGAVMGAFADKDKNGLPDLLENAGTINSQQMSIHFDGNVYHSLEELPPEVRIRYQEAMAKLDRDGNGLPDFVEHLAGGFAGMSAPSAATVSTREPDFQPSAPVADHHPVMETVGTNWKMLLLSLVIVGVACLGALVFWVLLNR